MPESGSNLMNLQPWRHVIHLVGARLKGNHEKIGFLLKNKHKQTLIQKNNSLHQMKNANE